MILREILFADMERPEGMPREDDAGAEATQDKVIIK